MRLWYRVAGISSIFLHTSTALAGPVSFSNEFPLNQVHLSSLPEISRPKEIDGVQIEGRFLWTNTFVLEEKYIIDSESRAFIFDASFALSDNAALKFEVPIRWRGGGVLDSIIKNWHETFSLPEGKRENVSDDQYQVSGETSGGGTFSHSDQGTSLGNVALRGVYDLWESLDQQLSIRGTVSLPTSQKTFGHKGIDGELSLLYAYNQEEWRFFAGGGLFAFTDESIGGVEYEPFHVEGFTGIDYELLEGMAVTLNVYAGQQSVENIPDLPDYFVYLDVGAKLKISEDLVFSFGLRENPTPHEGTSDVTFLVSISNY